MSPETREILVRGQDRGQAEARGGADGEMPGEGADVFGPIAQRRQHDGEDGDSAPQALAERPGGDRLAPSTRMSNAKTWVTRIGPSRGVLDCRRAVL
jgi:hypothetical protein